MGQEGIPEGRKERWPYRVKGLPNRVGDVIGARGRRVGRAGEYLGDFFRGKGGVVFVS